MIGKALRSIAGGIGDAAKWAAPAAAFIPGVGPIAAGAIGAAGGALGRLNDKREDGRYVPLTLGSMGGDALRFGAQGAIGGMGAKALAGKGAGAALGRLAKAGGAGMDWLTDPERGATRTALVTGLGSTAAGAMAGRQAGRAADAQLAHQRGREARWDPQRERIMEMFMERLGNNRPAGASA